MLVRNLHATNYVCEFAVCTLLASKFIAVWYDVIDKQFNVFTGRCKNYPLRGWQKLSLLENFPAAWFLLCWIWLLYVRWF